VECQREVTAEVEAAGGEPGQIEERLVAVKVMLRFRLLPASIAMVRGRRSQERKSESIVTARE